MTDEVYLHLITQFLNHVGYTLFLYRYNKLNIRPARVRQSAAVHYRPGDSDRHERQTEGKTSVTASRFASIIAPRSLAPGSG